ncbi:MAG: threonine/serine dehydratase [Actinomycetia bacterium]|nr:threonine/serine dehydratase [Actinomycetes bacterium]
MTQALTIDDINAAADRIQPWVHVTPVMQSGSVDEATGAQVHLKCEHLQRSGSFKARGAYNKMLSLTDEQRGAGVVAVSSGNHGAAVALAARSLGVEATVFMPQDAPELKRRATEAYGAGVVTFDRSTPDRDALAIRHSREHGSTIMEPYDDHIVMAGAGTAALELSGQAGFDVVVVPVSGGGLMAGSATALRATLPGVHIVGVEPATANDTERSLEAGEPIEVPDPQTVADGLAIPKPGRLTFPIVAELVDEIVTVEDADTLMAMRFLFERTKQVVEPSGAITLAAAMTGRYRGQSVALMASGGNIGAAQFAALCG